MAGLAHSIPIIYYKSTISSSTAGDAATATKDAAAAAPVAALVVVPCAVVVPPALRTDAPIFLSWYVRYEDGHGGFPLLLLPGLLPMPVLVTAPAAGEPITRITGAGTFSHYLSFPAALVEALAAGAPHVNSAASGSGTSGAASAPAPLAAGVGMAPLRVQVRCVTRCGVW